MKTSEVKIGGLYLMTISGRRTVVRLVMKMGERYSAQNLLTGRTIFLRSARRLQREVSESQATRLLSIWAKIGEMIPETD